MYYDKYRGIIGYMKKATSKVIKQTPTIFLRIAIIGLGLIAFGICGLITSAVVRDWASEFPDIASTTYPIVFCLVAVVITFWAALYQAWKVLNLIDKNQVFSGAAIKALYKIKFYLLVIAGLFVAGWPIIAYLAELDDAPGLILIYGTIFIGTPVVLAVAIAVLQRLLQNVIDIKSENDLTV